MLSKIRGTIETLFRIGIGGPNLKDNGGEIEARNAADAAFVNVRGADPVIADDLVTKRYADAIPASAVAYTPTVTTNWPNPTLPTTVQTAIDDVAWERGWEVNFVTDCGADPTGVVDCSAALNTAATILLALAADPMLPKKSCTLLVPRGKYLIGGTAKPFWSFTPGLMPMSIKIKGAGTDASLFELNCGAAENAFTFINAYQVFFEDLAFVGTQPVPGIDCQTIIDAQGTQLVSLSRVTIVWTTASFAQVFVGGGTLYMRDCLIASNGTTDGTKATIYMTQVGGLYMDNCRHFDTFISAGLNGLTVLAEKDYNTPCHVRLEDSTAINSAAGDFIHFRNCVWDEGTAADIIANGGPGANFKHIVIEDCTYNTPIGTAGGGGVAAAYAVHVSNTDLLDIHGLHNTGFNDTNIPMVDLVAVGTAYVQDIRPNPANTFKFITADAACGYVEVSDSNLTDIDTRSSAGLTTVKRTGQTADLFVANGIIAAHQLAKNITGGPIAITTTDQIDVVTGAARQATTGAGQHVALSRFGTPTVFLSDGTATIAIGDNLGISPTSPGRVRTVAAGAARVGVATAAAVAVADTPVNGYFAPLGVDQTFSTFAVDNPTLVPATGGRPNILQAGVVNANLPAITSAMIGQSIVVLCDGIASATVTAAGGQTIQEVGAGAPATPQTVTGSATFLAFNSTTWIMTP